MIEKCNRADVPERLHANVRNIDSVFENSEMLYRHYIPVEGEIPANSIDVRKTSMNRGKYMESPKDSLYSLNESISKKEYEVFGISVEKINKMEFSVEGEENRIFSFSPLHEPTPCMYPHSVIKPFESNRDEKEESIPLNKIKPNSIKNKYRSYVIENSIKIASGKK